VKLAVLKGGPAGNLPANFLISPISEITTKNAIAIIAVMRKTGGEPKKK